MGMTNTNKETNMTAAAKERHATSISPAHSAEGEDCSQCGEPAWHVQGVAFCRDHDQETYQ